MDYFRNAIKSNEIYFKSYKSSRVKNDIKASKSIFNGTYQAGIYIEINQNHSKQSKNNFRKSEMVFLAACWS